MKYNWQQEDWTNFHYNIEDVDEMLFAFAAENGHTGGVLKTLPSNIHVEAVIDTMVAEAIKTSAIEGENLVRKDVISSVRNNLGLNKKPEPVKDKLSQGAGELMVQVRKTFAEALTEKKLFAWHKMLFRQTSNIATGAWRTHKEPMQVISGAMGKEKIHFEAPPSSRVPQEMNKFIRWFNATAPGGSNPITKAPVRAAIAHLYFETIHPFEDGNGRIGRALAEKALSQTLGKPVLLSLSQIIERNKNAYYKALQQAQTTNNLTKWMKYFIRLVLDAQKQSTEFVNFILKKSQFFDRFKNELNERELKVIKKMFDAGPDGFEGGMTASKYGSVTKTSKATATRDLQHLSEQKILIVKGGGRNTHYFLNIENL